VKRGAVFSGCRTWRYALLREWDDAKPRAVLIGLNASTADEYKDDPTIRRGIGFATAWGCGSLHMLNEFAFCATDPRDMKRAFDPIGPMNDAVIRATCSEDQHAIIVAAWGAHGRYMDRDIAVLELLADIGVRRVECLGTTKAGDPRHPLYVRGDAPRLLYDGRGTIWREKVS
jgi:hypothetical protein